MAVRIWVADLLATSRSVRLWQLWHLLVNKAEPLTVLPPELELELELELEELELEELLEVDTGSGGSMVPV